MKFVNGWICTSKGYPSVYEVFKFRISLKLISQPWNIVPRQTGKAIFVKGYM